MPEIGTYSLSGGRRLARQRASSDPTDTLNHYGLPLSQTRWRHHPHQEELRRMKAKTAPARHMESGLDLEKQIPTPVEAELFFLTSLFIELIDLKRLPPNGLRCSTGSNNMTKCISS